MLQTQRDMFEAGAYKIYPNSQKPTHLEINECAKQLVQSSIDAASIDNNEPILLMHKEDRSDYRRILMNLANAQHRKTHSLVRPSRARGSESSPAPSLEMAPSTKQAKKNRISTETSREMKAGLEKEKHAIETAISARNEFIK